MAVAGPSLPLQFRDATYSPNWNISCTCINESLGVVTSSVCDIVQLLTALLSIVDVKYLELPYYCFEAQSSGIFREVRENKS